jgi:phage-related protein
MPKRAYLPQDPTHLTGMLKPVVWIGSSLDDLRIIPDEPRRVSGYGIHLAQLGRHHGQAKQLRGDLSGLVELVEEFDGDAFRVVYTVKLAGAVYVLHVFQKKSTHGIGTPKRDLAIIRDRLRRAKAHHAAHRAERGSHDDPAKGR